MKRPGVRTLLLGTVVVLMIATVFAGLPVRLPPWEDMSCDRVAFGCGAVQDDRNYTTMIWDSPEIPNDEELGARFMELMGRFESYGIPSYGVFRYDMEYGENGDNLTISGYLLYGLLRTSNEGIPDIIWNGGLAWQEILVQIEDFYDEGASKVRSYHIMTDRDGYFETTISLDTGRKCFELLVLYEGKRVIPNTARAPAQIYDLSGGIETECEYERLLEKTVRDWRLWVFGFIALGSLGYIIYRVIKKNRFKGATDEIPGIEKADFRIAAQPSEPEAGGDILRVAIQFDEIEPYLPAVWGIGEAITISVQLRNENSEVEQGVECRLETGDGTITAGTSDGNGLVQIRHRYEVIGSYQIMASCRDVRSDSALRSWRKLRVVEYREEMVRIFNDLIRRMNVSGIEISPEMTPRETEQVLKKRIEGVSGETIRRIVDGFEEANYSTHPVERTRYVRMYTAVREVLSNGRRSKQND